MSSIFQFAAGAEFFRGKFFFDPLCRDPKRFRKLVPTFFLEASRIRIGQRVAEQIWQSFAGVNSPHVVRRTRWRRVEIGIDKFDCLIHAFGGKNAAG